MGRSYTNIIIHIIFHVKNDECKMNENDLPQIFRYIGGIVHSEKSFVYTIGGRPNHIHVLATLPTNTSISEFVRSIKANTSRWIKGLHPSYETFAWQEGYAAFSVSESLKSTVIKYIETQKEHHKTLTAQEEFLQFLKKNGIVTDYKPH